MARVSTLRVMRVACALAVLLLASPHRADGWRVGGSVGVGVAYRQVYATVGGLVGRGLGLGFELSLAGDYWFANSPTLFKLSPGLTWYAPLPLGPYIGGYYAHSFVAAPLSDTDAVGVRGGLTLVSAGPVALMAGVAYERQLSCPRDCDSWRPEAMASFSF